VRGALVGYRVPRTGGYCPGEKQPREFEEIKISLRRVSAIPVPTFISRLLYTELPWACGIWSNLAIISLQLSEGLDEFLTGSTDRLAGRATRAREGWKFPCLRMLWPFMILCIALLVKKSAIKIVFGSKQAVADATRSRSPGTHSDLNFSNTGASGLLPTKKVDYQNLGTFLNVGYHSSKW
jgi:hypothetical protein